MRKNKKDDRLLSSHDLPFKAFFSENEVARSFLEENLPNHLIDRLDFSTLKIAKDSFVDKKLSQYFSDILYEVKLQGKPALVYLLFDHKSKEDKFTGFQLLKYMVRIWESYFKQNKKVGYLPIIIPMVVYHGEKKWRINSRFNSLFEETEHMEEYIPNFRYDVYDVSHIPDEDIKGHVLLKICLTALKYIMSPGLQDKLKDIFVLFDKLSDKKKATEYLEVLLRYLAASARSIEKKDLEEAVTRYIEKGGEIMQTIAEKLLEQGKEEGIQEGIREGRLQVVKKALEAGFPEDVISQISGLSIEEIRIFKIKKKPAYKKQTVH